MFIYYLYQAVWDGRYSVVSRSKADVLRQSRLLAEYLLSVGIVVSDCHLYRLCIR